MRERCVRLSKRLQMLASMVTAGNKIVDVGCDHGFLPIYLVQNGRIPGALAMDVRTGPLESAREHVAAYGLGEYIELRLSDGLKEYSEGEAETIICAGMGGRLMERILTESLDKVRTAKELILQPQSELREFRIFLREAGFAIREEDAVFEDGKYYFAMKAVYTGRSVCAEAVSNEEFRALSDLFGEILLRTKNSVLKQYLSYRQGILRRLQAELTPGVSERTDERLRKMERELTQVERALEYMR